MTNPPHKSHRAQWLLSVLLRVESCMSCVAASIGATRRKRIFARQSGENDVSAVRNIDSVQTLFNRLSKAKLERTGEARSLRSYYAH